MSACLLKEAVKWTYTLVSHIIILVMLQLHEHGREREREERERERWGRGRERLMDGCSQIKLLSYLVAGG